MILSICPSPSIDVNMEVESLSVGMSNKIISKRTFYTGKGINVAIGLARLQAEVFATGFMYKGNGSAFEHELHREGVPYKFVWNEGRVRENYKFVDRRSMLTEVDDLSSEIPPEKQDELVALVKSLSESCEAVVLAGSLARGMSPDYYKRLLSCVPATVKKVVDADGERLLSALSVGVDLVKPNLEELERTVRRRVNSKEELFSACREVLKRGAKIIIVSLGKRGAVITDGDKRYYCMSVNVAMNSTVGAGDGMVAAATRALVQGASLAEILRHGVAAGTAAVTDPDSISFTRQKYEEILSQVTVEEI